KKIAGIAGIDEQTIWRSIPAARRPWSGAAAPASDGAVTEAAPPTRRTLRQQVLGCILCEPLLWLTLSDAHRQMLDPELLETPASGEVAHAVFDVAAHGDWTFGDVCTHLEGADAQAEATALMMHMHSVTEDDPARLRTYLFDCLDSPAREHSAPISLQD